MLCPVTGKRKFDGEKHARKSRPKRSGARLRTYRCDYCTGWHLTNDEKRRGHYRTKGKRALADKSE